ncbi:GntR family transcriptional regulator [Blautia sp. XA-2221]|uniref:GntR family transcriptional regulator n=1 Tax=Blautia sp. XA-2221 TaxID=2903961 RepID=UPI0023782D37|nr:GntR family transcriptional regulator [Blautia sp. XA-2221]
MGIAKYRQVTEWIQNRIASGELNRGDQIESENDISRVFGISRQTVRHALGLLEQQGILTRIQGSGTFVRDEQAEQEEKKMLSHTVDILTTYVDGYIFPRILQSMVERLEKEGYSARIMFTGNRIETERRLLERMLDEGSRDPLIAEPVMSGLPNPNLKFYRRLLSRGIPILFFNSFYENLDIPHISMNDVQAGRTATEYLIEKGHTRIGGIFKADDGQGRRRYLGYLKALGHAGIEVNESRVTWVDTLEMKDFSRIMEKIQYRLSGCTACVCYNDEVAYELTRRFLKTGKRIPEDISIIGIDNSELAKLNPVPLTSVGHHIEDLGNYAAEAILRMIREPGCDVTYEFPVFLKDRMSVCQYTEQKKNNTGGYENESTEKI